MPTYTYRCVRCQAVSELVAFVKDSRAKIICGACSGIARRIISQPVPFHLLGGGWYETDRRRMKGRKIAEKAKEDYVRQEKSERMKK